MLVLSPLLLLLLGWRSPCGSEECGDDSCCSSTIAAVEDPACGSRSSGGGSTPRRAAPAWLVVRRCVVGWMGGSVLRGRSSGGMAAVVPSRERPASVVYYLSLASTPLGFRASSFGSPSSHNTTIARRWCGTPLLARSSPEFARAWTQRKYLKSLVMPHTILSSFVVCALRLWRTRSNKGPTERKGKRTRGRD